MLKQSIKENRLLQLPNPASENKQSTTVIGADNPDNLQMNWAIKH